MFKCAYNGLDVSKYYTLIQGKDNGFELVDNIDYANLLEDLSMHPWSDYYLHNNNLILLYLISLYDKNQYKETLDACIQLSELIY